MSDGTFIAVELSDAARDDAELAKKLEEACPVDIFQARRGGAEGEARTEIVAENLDECVLCELCLDAAPPGAVRVVKLYDNGAALER
jgi:NAD-dependent dihydropyrimidine dehydrogenase PreA subunit